MVKCVDTATKCRYEKTMKSTDYSCTDAHIL